ncbi:GPR1/FUN34/yaaH family-domain-containing protein [Gymnopilus junonius]|uniref:GPR1/FUN34/yaaH family-domain-containing protein n=1 Tax=Gymnopilus junonius TaxID=109634 RepID=A0A9P5NJU8_GYMJU|nr:GPR1/FUN34/yaaH family-domain-containing protein [Gymnopilus junonius]
MSNEKTDIEQISIVNGPVPSLKPVPPTSTIANPAPAGIFAFAGTTFLLSMLNVNTRGIQTPNVVVGMSLFAGGLLQFVAGMWEYPRGNVFGATCFSSFGTFWMSYATILIPGSGIISAYTNPKELDNALGLYLIVWMMLTKYSSFSILFGTLALAFGLLAGGLFTGVAKFTKAGGVVGIIVALVAYYIGANDLLAGDAQPLFRLPQENRQVWHLSLNQKASTSKSPVAARSGFGVPQIHGKA